MDLNVIFNNVVPIDENKNFVVNFKSEEEMISVLLNRKKDYFMSNAIIYINDPENDKKDTDIVDVKKLEEDAKKHIKMEEDNKFDTPFAKNFIIFLGENYLTDSYRPTYYFKFKEKEAKDFLKTYKYYNIEKEKAENFNAYNSLTHLIYGVDFVLDEDRKQTTPPITKINFKLNLDEQKIYVSSKQVKNNLFVKDSYSWPNKFVVVDGRNLKLITSSTGWLDIYTNLISNGGLQKYGCNILRSAFAAYYLERKKDLIFSHEDNFKKLTNYEKTLVFFVVTKEGYLTVNWGFHKNFYVGDGLHNKFNITFFKLCGRPDGVMTRQTLDIYSKNTSLNIPYKRLYKYRVINTFPNDAVWFDTNIAVIDGDWKVFMQIKITNEKYELLSDQNDPLLLTTLQQPTSSFNFHIKNDKLNTIKKYNDYSDKFKNLNIETVKATGEHSHFLYDNNALVRETFITEINKKVNLIGSITFYKKADKTGKSFLITSGTKLKFDLKENLIE